MTLKTDIIKKDIIKDSNKNSVSKKFNLNQIFFRLLVLTVLNLCIFAMSSSVSSALTISNKDVDDVVIKSGSRDKKIVAITFDDGPHPKETNQVLDVLKKYNIKATFFIAGKHANWYKEPLLRASKEGHEIGNHTFNHKDIKNLSSTQIEKEILDCENVLKELTGKKTTLFRPPYGSYREEDLINIAKKNNYKVVLWTGVDVKDWKNPPSEKMAQSVIETIKNGDIILLHDYGTENTVKALEIFIPKLQEKGFKFVTVSELVK